MATIKTYTDIEQSRKLAEILPLESADMYYYSYMSIGEPFYMSYPNVIEDRQKLAKNDIPCWSLSSLLDVLPDKLQIILAINAFQGYRKERYAIGSVEHDKYDCYADNPIDACYEMIIKLHELKML